MSNQSVIMAFAVFVITAVAAGLYLDPAFTDGDEGRYLLLATAIAEGHGQTDIHLPEPRLEGLTPPGYPVMLAGLLKLAQNESQGFLLLKALSYFSYLLYVLVLIRLSRSLIETASVRPAVLLIALMPVTALIYTWVVYADTLYLLVSGLAILACHRLCSDRPAQALWCGIFVALSMAVRPVGLALIPAVGLHLISRKNIRGGVWCTLGFCVFYLPVILFTYKALGVPFGYISHYQSDLSLVEKCSQILSTIGQILPYYLFEALPQRMFFSLMDGDCLLCRLRLSWLITPLSVLLSGMVLGGWLLRIRKLQALDLYFLFYMPMVSTYHVALHRGIEDRYLLPIFLHAALYLYTSFEYLSRKIPAFRQPFRWMLYGGTLYTVIVAAGAGLVRTKSTWPMRGIDPFSAERHIHRPEPSRQAFGRYIEAAEWLKNHTEANAIILSRKPRHTYLISRRKGFRLNDLRKPGEAPYDTLVRQRKHGPVYVLQDAYPDTSSYGRDRQQTIDPMLRDFSERFEKVFETEPPATHVWKYRP